jgi:hypothetical protein
MRARKMLVGDILLSFDHLLGMLLDYLCASMHSFSVFFESVNGINSFFIPN